MLCLGVPLGGPDFVVKRTTTPPPPSFCTREQEIINYPSIFIEDVQSVGLGGGWTGARDIHIVQTGSCTSAARNIRWIPEIKRSLQEADRPLPFIAELNIITAILYCLCQIPWSLISHGEGKRHAGRGGRWSAAHAAPYVFSTLQKHYLVTRRALQFPWNNWIFDKRKCH